ncbi:GNAT family N-acetyltransferase [Litorivivens sp.]|uniref:GNAT family N-acetyltransferase n=1 Tax=Litorivivens sp. TaxID=2020868 RepID=UPI003563067E
MGPISVEPSKQSQGIGARLMKRALAEFKSLKANGCVWLGDPGYYHRIGFRPVDGLVLPDE